LKTKLANEIAGVDGDVVAQAQRLGAHGALEALPVDVKNFVRIRVLRQLEGRIRFVDLAATFEALWVHFRKIMKLMLLLTLKKMT